MGNGGRPAPHHPVHDNMWTEGLSTADRPQKKKNLPDCMMEHRPTLSLLTSLTFILVWFRWPGVSSTIYTIRPGQRLIYNPMILLTFSESHSSFMRCIVTCKSTAGCSAVNVHMDELTSLMTCELLGIYLHEARSNLTSASGWTFIQEGWYVCKQNIFMFFRYSGDDLDTSMMTEGRSYMKNYPLTRAARVL